MRTVSVFPQRGGGVVALRLGKKRLHGAFATYKDCKYQLILRARTVTTLFLRCVVVVARAPCLSRRRPGKTTRRPAVLRRHCTAAPEPFGRFPRPTRLSLITTQ